MVNRNVDSFEERINELEECVNALESIYIEETISNIQSEISDLDSRIDNLSTDDLLCTLRHVCRLCRHTNIDSFNQCESRDDDVRHVHHRHSSMFCNEKKYQFSNIHS